MGKKFRKKGLSEFPQPVQSPSYDPSLISQLLQQKERTLFKRKKIFADSNFFVALSNPSDTLYMNAILIAQTIEEENAIITISNFILLETVTTLSQQVGKEAGLQAGRKLLMEDYIEHIHITESLQKRTWQIFQSIDKKNMSFIDCSILAAMEQEDIPYLLTFDQKDFQGLRKEYGFEFYPK